MNLPIEDELGVTRTQRVNITLKSTDERIALQQVSAEMEIKRIPSMWNNSSYSFRDHGRLFIVYPYILQQ